MVSESKNGQVAVSLKAYLKMIYQMVMVCLNGTMVLNT